MMTDTDELARRIAEAVEQTALDIDALATAFHLTDEERAALPRFLASFRAASEAGGRAMRALGIQEGNTNAPISR